MEQNEKEFWNNVLDENAVVIAGNCYHIEPDDKPQCGFLGYNGTEFKIKFRDGRVVVTHNLWHNGEIPEELGIQNNAEFI